jgi:intracellular sulfur oxidation DsrE/DsrF family protein
MKYQLIPKEVERMKTESRKLLLVLFFSVVFLLGGNVNAAGGEYESMKGVYAVKAVFDMRAGSPKSAALLLDLIHQTYRDKNIAGITSEPAFTVVFIGPSVKLISKNRDGFSPEDQKSLEEIARTVSRMSEDGIKLEICLFAADLFGVDHASILPEVKQVPNGFISVIAYQAKGFALVPVY